MVQRVSEKLATTFAGVRMRSPVGVGPMNMPRGERSAITPEIHAELLLKHVEAGAGFVYVPGFKYITEELIKELRPRARPRDSTPRPAGTRFMKIETPGFGVEGLLNFGMTMTESAESSLAGFDKARKTLEIVKKKLPEGVPIFVTTSPLGNFAEPSVLAAKKVEELGVDLIELILSCGLAPSVEGAIDYYLERKFPLIMCGTLVAEYFDLVEKIVRETVKAVKIPVGVKLWPEMSLPRAVELARILRDAGAKYVEISNFATTIAPPDIYNRGKSRWPYIDGNPFVGGSGGSLRAGCYRNVAGVAKFAPGIEIAASGGLLTPEHVVEVMMLGAGLAEFVTGILLQGRSLLRRTTEFLKRFMEEQGYKRVEDFVGLGVQYIEPCDRVEFYPGKVVAEVDPTKCKESGLCTDHVCVAIVRENGKAKVIPEACDGCGLCVENCPNGAIRLRFID